MVWLVGLGRLVVWDSRGAPKNPNPFHFRGFQESKPPGPKPTINYRVVKGGGFQGEGVP